MKPVSLRIAHIVSYLFISLNLFANSSKNNFNDYTGSLTGHVTDRLTGRSIPGATVYITDLKLGAVSDTAGHFSFKNLPSGNFLVEARSVGYKALTQNVTINGAAVLDFALTQNIVEESEVVVTGISRAGQIKRSPIPIVSVSRAALATNINTNIIDALTRVPGITAVTTGPNIAKPFIRGLGYNRVLTLYDGVRQEGQQWGDEHGIEVDQYSIDRVEIIKGPASLSYGSDAVAGVVNLIPTQPAPEGKIVGDILSEYYSNNKELAGSAMLSGTQNGIEWLGRMSHKQATNYQNKIDGRVYGTAFNETDATAYLGLHRKWGYSHLSFSMFNDLQEIPDGSRDSATGRFTKQITEDDLYRPFVTDQELNSYTIAAIHQHVQHYRGYSNNSFTLGKGRLTVNVAYQKSLRQEFSHPEQPLVPGLYLNMDTYVYDIKYYLPELNGWNVTLGVNGMYQNNDVSKGTEFVVPSYHQFDIGPFAFAKKTIDKWDIAGGIRFDSRNFSNSALYTKTDPSTKFDIPVYGADTAGANRQFSNYSHLFSGASGSLGFTYNANEKISFKANIARGFRAPNVAEISSNGVHPGSGMYQIGNTDFKPEFNLQEDIGFVYSDKYVVVNLSIFYNQVQNYIFNRRLPSLTGTGDSILSGVPAFKYQQGKAALYGGEMNVDFHPAKNLHFENSLSLVYGDNLSGAIEKITSQNKYLPLIPPFHGLSELRYDINSKASHLVNGYIKAQMVYYAAQNRVYLENNTETPTPGYILFNLGAGTGISNKHGKTVVNLSIIANNIFDVAYYNHMSRLKYFLYSSTDTDYNHGIHDMGRNVAFRLDFPLSFDRKKQ